MVCKQLVGSRIVYSSPNIGLDNVNMSLTSEHSPPIGTFNIFVVFVMFLCLFAFYTNHFLFISESLICTKHK